VSIFVDNQDDAERFSPGAGIQGQDQRPLRSRRSLADGRVPEQPDGVELVLHLADEPARAFRQASREVGRPALSLRTDDCATDAERPKAKGVVFVEEPRKREYGGIDAIFDDTSGNLINLHQD
jgi:hypothetical protein